MKIQSNIPNSRDFKVVSEALRAIRFPLSYSDWMRIGFALYASFGMEGMQLLYDVSCAPSPEYRNETPEKLAAKFRKTDGRVTLGTIFHYARQHGWKRKQPTKIQNEDWHLVAWHDYRDAEGNLAYRMNRLVSPDGKEKRMTIERYENGERKFDLPDELRLPYNLPQVREAIQKGETIYFVEGESDADALAANERTATCVPFGAGGWNKRYVEHFKGASICFIPDNDKTGKALPLRAIPDLLSVAKEVKVIELSDAKDVRELINTKGIEAFKSLTLTPIDASQYLEKHKSKHKLPEAYPPTRLKVKLDVKCPKCDLFTLDIFEQDGKYFLKCLRCDFGKPVIEFRDNLDEGKVEIKCPRCGLWQEDIHCKSCGYTTAEFKLMHESTLRHEAAATDQTKYPLEQKYPLEGLNGTPPQTHNGKTQTHTQPKLLLTKPVYSWIDEANSQPPITSLFDVFWLSGELAFLFGSTNVGKTILAVQIADVISKGMKIQGFDGVQEPMKVCLFDFELSARQFAKRYSDGSGNIHDFSPNFFRAEIDANAEIPKGISFQDYMLEQIEKTIIEHRIEVAVINNKT